MAVEPGDNRWVSLELELTAYRQKLYALRREQGGVRKLPPATFFLFGMGDRRKLVYQHGVLSDARTGQEIRRWSVSAERIVPPSYTMWAKLGLTSLGLDYPYAIPKVADSYATLCWWAHQGDDRSGQEVIESDDYPYLTWAGSHYSGKHKGKLGDQDYRLTWEAKASQADYRGMDVISPVYAKAKLCTPHTWHAAEAFLYLLEQKE